MPGTKGRNPLVGEIALADLSMRSLDAIGQLSGSDHLNGRHNRQPNRSPRRIYHGYDAIRGFSVFALLPLESFDGQVALHVSVPTTQVLHRQHYLSTLEDCGEVNP